MRSVPREEFVPEELRSHAYSDGPLPIGEGQTISQPFIVASMVESLELRSDDHRVTVMNETRTFNLLDLQNGVYAELHCLSNFSFLRGASHPQELVQAAAVDPDDVSMLEDLAENNKEKYATFWKEFGRVFKEGLGEDHANRERIAKLARFASTHKDTEDEDVSLADYVGRMKEGQEAIYYITGVDKAQVEKSPHLEVFRKHGVIHYCVPNVASRVAHTATTALSNIFTPTILRAGEEGGIEEMIFSHKWFMKGVYTYKGGLTNENVARKFGLKYKNIDLLFAARF